MSAQPKTDMKASMRWAIVTLAICSWIAISNHCAFAAVTTEVAKAQTECPFHSKPAKQKEQSSQVQCCKILRAVVLAKTKDWARDDAKFSNANVLLEIGLSRCERPGFRSHRGNTSQAEQCNEEGSEGSAGHGGAFWVFAEAGLW